MLHRVSELWTISFLITAEYARVKTPNIIYECWHVVKGTLMSLTSEANQTHKGEGDIRNSYVSIRNAYIISIFLNIRGFIPFPLNPLLPSTQSFFVEYNISCPFIWFKILSFSYGNFFLIRKFMSLSQRWHYSFLSAACTIISIGFQP